MLSQVVPRGGSAVRASPNTTMQALHIATIAHKTHVIPSHHLKYVARAGVDVAKSVSDDDIAKFEKIAASLAEKYQDLTEEEFQQQIEGVADDDLLVDFGADIDELRVAQEKALDLERMKKVVKPLRAGPVLPRNRRKQQIAVEHLPKVAIVGRPNVGKSAMFNRLSGSSTAVVYDSPGITRDRLYTRAFWGDKEYVLIDTGGLINDSARLPTDGSQSSGVQFVTAEGLPEAIERQAAAGVAEADTVVLLADGQAGLQPGDQDILDWLRSEHPSKPVILAVNKCENTQKADMQAAEFWELGIEPHPVSAISGLGTGELLDILTKSLPPPKSNEVEDTTTTPLPIAIIGRPNVGKSSLLNAIAGEERAIVCDMSGTTRDAVDTDVTLPDGSKVTLIDTAGIRRRARLADTKDSAESISVERALGAIKRAEVAVLVIDATEGVTQQDFRLSELVSKEGKALVVVANKWDKIDLKKWTLEKYTEEIKANLRLTPWASIVCTVATSGERVQEVLKSVLAAGEEHRRRISTATLNMVLKEATSWKAPPSTRGSGGRKGKIYYATQAGVKPPTFIFFVNDEKLIPDDYRRYMERQLRENIGFPGTPLRLLWRGKPGREKGVVTVRPAPNRD